MAAINNPPTAGPIVDELGNAVPPYVSWLMQIFRLGFDIQNSGTTAQRPTATLYTGKFYFDTTLGRPIWLRTASPAVWVDATGAVV